MFIFWARPVFAFIEKNTFPKLADLFLNPNTAPKEKDKLSKYDLLIIDVDTVEVDPKILDYLKNKNKQINIFAYIPSQSVNLQDLTAWAQFRRKMYGQTDGNNWWLRDSKNNYVTFPGWPTIQFTDGGEAWNNYLSNLSSEAAKKNNWDGVFYDMVFPNLSWLNSGDLDINKDGQKDNAKSIDNYWYAHMDSLLSKTREKLGGKLLIANIGTPANFENRVNGMLFESFPSPWLGSDAWEETINEIINKMPVKNQKPNIYIVAADTNNSGKMESFQKMRFGLSSALLGDAYYAFDSGAETHAQAWWYDEYEIKLGAAQSRAYNLLDKENKIIKKGLWRRDFKNGISIVNSTSVSQVYVFSKEEFEKINGTQDRRVNDGTRINWIKIPANDGVVLLKENKEIVGNSFTNGDFARVFDYSGSQKQNGFFSYKDEHPGSAQILIDDIDNDGDMEELVNSSGRISIYKNGNLISTFLPYDGKFNGEISFAVSDLNCDGTKEIITGAGAGGGPHVRIFGIDGRQLTGGFFAYDENFRGGVNVAVIDMNGDGTKEIITGAGAGGGPHVRVFTKDGRPLTGGFFAYGQNFRGGVSVATGDINGNGTKEIITGAGAGGSSKVKVFTKDGRLVSEFYGYSQDFQEAIRVMASDMDKDGIDEILVGGGIE
ncbi:MAG: putative glycoside hydrolase [bacterium]